MMRKPIGPSNIQIYVGLFGIVHGAPLPPIMTRWHKFLRFMGWR